MICAGKAFARGDLSPSKTTYASRVPEIPSYKEAPEQLARWLKEELPVALDKIEHGLINSVMDKSNRYDMWQP